MNMSSITFYNMGFGDSFLIENNESSLLVDCGTYYDSRNSTNLTTFIISNHLEANERKDLMITHYHEDHFNKLLNLSNLGIRFGYIYIRNLGKNLFSFDFYSIFSELTKYAKRTGDYKTYIAWLSKGVLSKLISRGGTAIGLNSDRFANFRVGNLKAKVLWPTSNLPTEKKNKMTKYAKEIENILKENVDGEVFGHIKSVKDFFEKIYNSFEENSVVQLDGFYEESIDSPLLSEEEAINLVDTIDPLLDKIRGYILDLENYLSIVFETENGLLMCGDATKTAMKKALLNSSLAESEDYKYKVVKIPHHGTKPYYFKKHYDSSTHLLIPNSFQIRTPSWGIYNAYSYPYTSNCHCLNNSPTSACGSICHCSCYTTLLYKKIVF